MFIYEKPFKISITLLEAINLSKIVRYNVLDFNSTVQRIFMAKNSAIFKSFWLTPKLI